MTARAWIDDATAYHRRDTADLERDAPADRETEAREELESVRVELLKLTREIAVSAATIDRMREEQHDRLAQYHALQSERDSLTDELESLARIADRGGRE